MSEIPRTISATEKPAKFLVFANRELIFCDRRNIKGVHFLLTLTSTSNF